MLLEPTLSPCLSVPCCPQRDELFAPPAVDAASPATEVGEPPAKKHKPECNKHGLLFLNPFALAWISCEGDRNMRNGIMKSILEGVKLEPTINSDAWDEKYLDAKLKKLAAKIREERRKAAAACANPAAGAE